jgi:hypothetical protein
MMRISRSSSVVMMMVMVVVMMWVVSAGAMSCGSEEGSDEEGRDEEVSTGAGACAGTGIPAGAAADCRRNGREGRKRGDVLEEFGWDEGRYAVLWHVSQLTSYSAFNDVLTGVGVFHLSCIPVLELVQRVLSPLHQREKQKRKL